MSAYTGQHQWEKTRTEWSGRSSRIKIGRKDIGRIAKKHTNIQSTSASQSVQGKQPNMLLLCASADNILARKCGRILILHLEEEKHSGFPQTHTADTAHCHWIPFSK